MKIVFMGTPDFAVPALETIHKKFGVIAVYTQPDKPVGRGLETRPTPVKSKALELGVEVRQPHKLTDVGEFEKLSALKPELIVVAAYGQILKKNVLELPRLGCVNIHSSLLPRWRGAAPIQWAILSGDKLTGISTMKMDVGLDTGDVYLQEKTPITPEDTAQSLHDRLSEIGSRLIVTTIEGLATGSLQSIKQDEALVTHASKLTKEMEIVQASKSAEEVDCRIRGLYPWPGTSIVLESGERIKVKKARLSSLRPSLRVGQVGEFSDVVVLQCSTGCVELIELQPEGKKTMSAISYLNGLKGQGKRLPLQTKIS